MELEPPEITLTRMSAPEEYGRLVFDYHLSEGWNPSVFDSKIDRGYAGYRNFWLWRVNGEHLMICSFVKNKPLKLVFWGCYVTNPKFRGLGVSYRLFREQFDRLVAKGYRVLCCAVPDMTQRYVDRLGMARQGRVDTLELDPGEFRGATDLDRPRRASRTDLERLAEFDRRVSGLDRKGVLEAMLGEPEVKVFVAEVGGRIVGSAVLIPGVKDVNLAPLYSLDRGVAEALLAEVVRQTPEGKKVLMDAPTLSGKDSKAEFLTRLGFRKRCDYEFLGQTEYPGDLEAMYAIAGSQYWF